MKTKILLVEDDAGLRESISDYLEAKSGGEFQVVTAMDGGSGAGQIQKVDFGLILLDIMLPGQDGFSLCRQVREKGDTPVIFLTARAMEEDKLWGYELGCDDYLVKPFSLAELYVRIRALLRRTGAGAEELRCGEIILHRVTGQITVEGIPLDIPRREYTLLKYLMEHQGQLLSRAVLLDRVWGMDFEGSDRVVDNHIRKLRKHLGKHAGCIKTVIGLGYRMEAVE